MYIWCHFNIYIYGKRKWQKMAISVCLLQIENGDDKPLFVCCKVNRKREFVFLSWQTVNWNQRWLLRESANLCCLTTAPGAVFTEAKSGIIDPGLNQRRQFCPDFQFVWTKWSRWRKLLSHWLLWRVGLWFQPIVSDFLHCRKLYMNSTNFRQKILDYLISIISSRSFPHCEYRFWA